MAATSDYVLFNVLVSTSRVPSAPVALGSQNDAVSIGLTLISGSCSATNPALFVEQSNDLQNWGQGTITQPGGTLAPLTGPTFVEATATGITMKYARVVASLNLADGIMNVSLVPFRA